MTARAVPDNGGFLPSGARVNGMLGHQRACWALGPVNSRFFVPQIKLAKRVSGALVPDMRMLRERGGGGGGGMML